MFVEAGRTEKTFRERSTSVLWVGNLREVKRPDRLLQLASAAPELSFEMIGGTQPHSEGLYRHIEREAAGMANVIFAGPIPYHEVGPRFERARVLVNTSDVEGFPNTFLQAWMRGVPVVSFFDPDGLIARERLGVAVSNQEAMLETIRHLATDESAWSELSARCANYAREAYPEDQVLEPYLQAFSGSSGRFEGPLS
jgi:glycosyltransferase involved in cell wall biosynthesis